MDQNAIVYQLQALSSAPRLRILAYLKKKHVSTLEELARVVRLSKKTVFYHLSRLVARKIIERIRKGGSVTYRLSPRQQSPVQHILALL